MKFEISSLKEFDYHEEVIFFSDKKSGLRAFIAIHNTALGPATGGTRYQHYHSEQEALEDALRLSKSMTYKCALAQVPFGGGKAVITSDPTQNKRLILKTFAKKINLFNGHFTTGEDVGLDQKDIELMQSASPFINGRPGLAGDLSPWAALGVFAAIQSALKFRFNSATIKNRSFAIKGVGKVGMELCKLLYKVGGIITVTDVDANRLKLLNKMFPKIKTVPPRDIHKQKVDVFSPCALNGDLNSGMIAKLRCKIVCGAANNQLASPEMAEILNKLRIIYIPDYIANAGGLINAVAELRKEGYDRNWVKTRVSKIGSTVKNILALSKKQKKSPLVIANLLAEKVIQKRHA
ncbi:MAG: hypothetical protein A3C85_03615 [Candidatus Doudnabacteria bacterium RIFCSPHIGHO2_02_FULL_48_21]|uniref:Glutamate/phenylalanine/leucine/valine/L-tryptophan dehydrogenase C-terminal domain-containing protein n=1 Tax=Candidatus Doudnabacteria bacterium RIFCSPLOWO2_02_FULL_48_13 TaxID=1817845 RepID=A0A1F5QC80_9BACT|nr:MAG: hypothetical protein A3K05_01965 [Candidatus Doudnabacteria bacterium RIFCSPHIGHO2_01_48_18]OGE91247.1 MAG: hypothetical protein A3F44_02765 [Candidatus Doudnabacteria bacterium RIFCSPHIGHO2_12_FULL_47_25]OGE93697.1 MAG: hypothetical protein A3C85_03615 [Candidatus Doudnabacteria bacterium RIFCSPHIGHO2_02_FULL_48_21]OGE99794.1 MAG: hypothetical protein A3J05_00795 [Candidatus Doudnabacteria bacterium RIFCSPLOWO2_02_FULL_48_13]OGF00650.1 MAG: hypothetical protein A3G07_04525 [Candidatus 